MIFAEAVDWACWRTKAHYADRLAGDIRGFRCGQRGDSGECDGRCARYRLRIGGLRLVAGSVSFRAGGGGVVFHPMFSKAVISRSDCGTMQTLETGSGLDGDRRLKVTRRTFAFGASAAALAGYAGMNLGFAEENDIKERDNHA